MEFTADVRIMLKSTVNDPQGAAIENGLHSLGFTQVRDVRLGKRITFQITEDSQDAANSAARSMCVELLANGVIETYEVSIHQS